MGLKDVCKGLSKLATQAELVFEWAEGSTHRSNVIKTKDARADVHKDLSSPGWAIAKIQINKEAKDPGAKEFLKKGNTGAHKTTHKNLAEIRFSQVSFDQTELQRQIANAWLSPGAKYVVATGEPSSSGGKDASEQSVGGAGNPSQEIVQDQEWVWDDQQKMHRYWNGETWMYHDKAANREKYWDGQAWQWKS